MAKEILQKKSNSIRWRAASIIVRCLIFLLILVSLAAAVLWYLSQPTPDEKAYTQVTQRWEETDLQFRQLIEETPDERSRLVAEYKAEIARLSDETFVLADKHAGTKSQVAMLLFLYKQTTEEAVKKKAEHQLIGLIKSMGIDLLANAMNQVTGLKDPDGNLVQALIGRLKTNPDHPSAARFISRTCIMIDDVRTPAFNNIAETIVERYRESEEISNFCEKLGMYGRGSVAGAEEYLPHLNTIYQDNPHRNVRCASLFAIAYTHQNSSSVADQQKAVDLYRQFLNEFDGEERYRYSSVERMLRHGAVQAIETIELRGVGKASPEINGYDLEGQEMRLSQFKGRVVLLSFWASWCYPCLKMVPHEIELAAEFKNQPFTLVGVNGDTELAQAQQAARKHGISWPSFQIKDRSGVPVSEIWAVSAWPTIVLIGPDGSIRKSWVGEQDPNEIRREIQMAIDSMTK